MTDIDLVVVDKAGNKSAPFRVTIPVAAVPSGRPNASNTGVPAGVTLTPYTGPSTITTAGTVIDSKLITGALLINASNVKLSRCKLVAPKGGNAAIQVGYPVATTGFTVTDCELYGGGVGGSTYGVAWGQYTLTRCNVYGFIHCAEIGGDNVTIQDSYLHDPSDSPDGNAHIDTVQITSGANIKILRNTLENPNGQTAALLAAADQGPTSNLLVDGNVFAGGGYSMYLTERTAPTVMSGSIAVTNNRWSWKFYAKGGFYGPTNVNLKGAYTWTNNVWDDTNLPVTG